MDYYLNIHFQIGELEEELEKQKKISDEIQEDMEKFRTSDAEKQERINELEDFFLNKDKEFDKLQNEVAIFNIYFFSCFSSYYISCWRPWWILGCAMRICELTCYVG